MRYCMGRFRLTLTRQPKIEEINRDAIDSLPRVAVMPSDPNGANIT